MMNDDQNDSVMPCAPSFAWIGGCCAFARQAARAPEGAHGSSLVFCLCRLAIVSDTTKNRMLVYKFARRSRASSNLFLLAKKRARRSKKGVECAFSIDDYHHTAVLA